MLTEDSYHKTKELKKKTLSKSDMILLSKLEEDSRQSISQLAVKLRISQQLLAYRLKSLKKRKILSGFYTQINFPMFGYTKYRLLVRISDYSQKKEKEIIDYLIHHPNVQWIIECGGQWDYIINFIAKNVVQFDHFLKEFKNKFPKQIQNYDVIIVIEFIELGRSYFTKKRRDVNRLSYFGRDYKSIKVDSTDLNILHLISENARMNAAEIANKIGVSFNTVSSRINKLKEKGIIRAFKPLINLENTPYETYKATFKFQNCTEQKENEIIDYLKTDMRVVALIKLLGKWDFEIEFEVDSGKSMMDFIRGFRDKFKDIIKEFELIPLYHEFKYNYFPGDLIS
jgi:Lrp/AsnC family leucine-responsive transcriptional regulator